jgi:hypothetical protein
MAQFDVLPVELWWPWLLGGATSFLPRRISLGELQIDRFLPDLAAVDAVGDGGLEDLEFTK